MFEDSDMRYSLHTRHRHDGLRPAGLVTTDPELEALLAALVTALEAARATVEDLAGALRTTTG